MFEKRKESFSEREERILNFWEKEKIFEKSIENKKGKEIFSFYDGPPFATGLPHYGNLLAQIIKDVIPRYKTMKGYFVPRRSGWDCHGLPVENEIEKAKQLSGAKEIKKFGIANFNEECRSIVLRYTGAWEKIVSRIGRWSDFSNNYRTMDLDFMESVWWVFKELYNKGLIYEGFKVMPFSTKLETPLSNFEANLNYREVKDPSITVLFELLDEKNTYFLAWTTTPWTLISNLALTVNENIEYAKVKSEGKIYILAKDRIGFYFKENFEVLNVFKGKDLVDKRYKPLFSYFDFRKKEGAFRVIADDFVMLEEGTGIVHTAPAFGEMDFFVCQREKIEVVCPVDSSGRFTGEVKDFEGLLVKDADDKIIENLKRRGKIFKKTKILHRYPFCWRSDTPLIYKAVNTWFVAVEKIKQDLIEVNEKIYWMPEHIKYGRFGKWIENARDWAISRNRYWGTPIPIWKSEDGDIIVFGSIKELEEKTNTKIKDLHRHHIDKLTFKMNGKVYKRIFEVFDCWFESGSMPYGQSHYPFENKEEMEKSFPADFIAEGLDQTRGWFYTLNVLSTALFKKPAFKNVIVNGIILAENGVKMSKRLKNYPDPIDVINKFGSDAMRLYLINSPVVKAQDFCFSEKGVEEVLKKVIIPFYNCYLFLSTYVKIYNWKPQKIKVLPKNDIDRWILSRCQRLILEVEKGLESYDLMKATFPIIEFIDLLTNWYIRRSRARFWSDEDNLDRKEAFLTLYTVLLDLTKITAPFIPFITEAIFQELNGSGSVHLEDFPKYKKEFRNEELEKEMFFVQQVVSIGHSLRKNEKIKVRQPLLKAKISAKNEILNFLKKQKNLIVQELNVKEIEFLEDESEFTKLIAKPNFRLLGKRFGNLMPILKKKIEQLDQKELFNLKSNNFIQIEIDGKVKKISLEEVEIIRVAKEQMVATSLKDIAICLDVQITKDLFLEGLAREIVNKINTMRKEKDFNVTDRIKVKFDTTEKVKEAIKKYKSHICKEILAKEILFEKCLGSTFDLNGEPSIIFIEKI